MKGRRVESILAENLQAVNPHIQTKQEMFGRKRMCWKCQKDKSPAGGHMKTFAGGPMKFICKDCLEGIK